MPARAAGHQHEDGGRRPAVRIDRVGESPIWCSRSAARCRVSTATVSSAVRSWRRCSVRCSTTRSGTSSARSIRTASSIPARSSTRRRSPPNLRYGPALSHRSRSRSSTTPTTAGWPGPSRCAAGSAPAARRWTGRCVRRTWRRARRRTRRAGARTSCGWRWPGEIGEAGLGDEGCPRGARPVSRMPRLQGRVSGRRRRRAVQERVPGRLLAPARHAASCARARPCSRSCRAVGQPARAALERDRSQRAGELAERAGPRARSPARVRRPGPQNVRAAVRWVGERAKRQASRRQAPARQVAIFNDTFTNYLLPSIGMAGVNVLRTAAASTASLAPNVVLRPADDFAGSARRRHGGRHAITRRSAVSRLRENGLPIVFFEPSCLSAIREERPSLLRGETQRRRRWCRPLGAVRGVARSRVEQSAPASSV